MHLIGDLVVAFFDMVYNASCQQISIAIIAVLPFLSQKICDLFFKYPIETIDETVDESYEDETPVHRTKLWLVSPMSFYWM